MSSQLRTRNYDLHSHSTASDGELAPQALVEHAAANGVEVLALTDHDDTSGLAAARARALELGIGFVAGVEISALWRGRGIHIVGLAFDPGDPALRHGLATLRERRQRRGEEIGRRLEKCGIEGALEGARRYANGEILSRTHFARHLLEQGHVKSLNDAFRRYLGDGKRAHVSCQWATLEEAVGWITGAGGVAVVAHPARYKLTATKLRELLYDFREVGGAAIEVVSGSQDVNQTRALAEHARRFGLLASRGSDYHGPSQPWIGMGRLPPLPEGCDPVWRLWEEGTGVASPGLIEAPAATI